MYNDYFDIRDKYLEHYGVKGMKWRFSKFTNKIKRGGRDIYEYANRKATYYGGQARREFNKAKRIVRKGMKSFGANASTALGRASQLLKSKSGYYSGKARLGFNKARRLVRTGINNLGSSLQKAGRAAYHNINAKYNPGAIGRRISRAYNIYNMNKQTQAKKGTTGVRSVLYKRGSTPKQSDYSKYNPSQRYTPSHYTPVDYSKKKKTGRSASGGGGRW